MEGLLEAIITEAPVGGNAVFTFGFLAVAFSALILAPRALTPWGAMFLRGAILVGFAGSFRLGPWLLSGLTRAAPEAVHAMWILPWREEINVGAALLFAVGVSWCIGALSRTRSYWFWAGWGMLISIILWVSTSYYVWNSWEAE